MRVLASVARIARPIAPPICCEVLMSPLASPDSRSSTPATAAIVIGTKTMPAPTAHDDGRAEHVRHEAAVGARSG